MDAMTPLNLYYSWIKKKRRELVPDRRVTICVCMYENFTSIKVFIFKKFQGAQILIFFCENRHGAYFYIKNKRRNTNFKIDFLKAPFWTPKKVRFWFFEENPQTIFFLRVLALIQL